MRVPKRPQNLAALPNVDSSSPGMTYRPRLTTDLTASQSQPCLLICSWELVRYCSSHIFYWQFWRHRRIDVESKDRGHGRPPKQIGHKSRVFTMKVLLQLMHICSWGVEKSKFMQFNCSSQQENCSQNTVFFSFNDWFSLVLLDF